MADARKQSTRASQIRFLVRAGGALSLLVVALALLLVRAELAGDSDGGPRKAITTAAYVALAVGAISVVLWAAFELAGLVKQSTGRKAAVGTNLALQIALAVVLLAVVNAVSFIHYGRGDATRDRRFTLAPELKEKLRTLSQDAPTKVVVLQRGKTATIEPDTPGALESAAEAKIVEKVRDLVDELRELGPRFQVTVLATRDEDFDAALAKLTRELPARDGETAAEKARRATENQERNRLRAAIQSAPENSVFFAGNGRVQRLGFNQFYMLDKTASLSRDKPDGRNLVLVPQGKAAFVGKVLELEQRTPKVGLLTIHPLLDSESDGETYTAAGAKKALENNGFDVTDVLLKRWPDRGSAQPAADAPAEQKLSDLEESVPALQQAVARYTSQAGMFQKMADDVQTLSFAEINRKYRAILRGVVEDESDRGNVLEQLKAQVFRAKSLAKLNGDQLAKDEAEYGKIVGDDKAVESLRNRDVKAKMAGYVRDCDVLVVPRLTIMQLAESNVIPGWLHAMVKEQADVVREFLAAGKPVLFALGPTVADPPPQQPGESSNDDVEKMLARLGIDLGTDAIITDAEVAAVRVRSGSFAAQPDPAKLKTFLELPPAPAAGKLPNPIADSYRAAARSVDADLDANREGDPAAEAAKAGDRRRLVFSVAKNGGYRSITVTPATAARLPYAPEILFTVNKSWNETKPLKDASYVPTFDAPRPDDPKKGGREDEVMKAYSVGVALETRVPAEWTKPVTGAEKLLADAGALAPTATAFPPGLAVAAARTPDDFAADAGLPLRVVVFGHGGLFVGKTLDPARETLLLNSLDWLLGRGDRLPHDLPDAEKWRYPRVAASPAQLDAPAILTAAGPSLVAIFVGFLVLMARRFR